MSIKIVLSTLSPSVPGRAKLTIKNWDDAIDNLQLAIQRGQDENYLHDGQLWSNNPNWFHISHAKEIADEVIIELGKELVDPILAVLRGGPLLGSLRNNAGETYQAVVMVKEDGLLSSLAGDGTYRNSASTVTLNVAEAAPEISETPYVEHEIPEVLAVDEPRAAPAKTTSNILLPILLGLIGLLLLLAIVWYFFLRDTALTQPTDPEIMSAESAEVEPETLVPEQAPAPVLTKAETAQESTAIAPCSTEAMTSLAELAFVQSCIKSTPDSQVVLDVIALAKSQQRCGIAQRLYAHKGQSGDVEVALAYAREYDPKYHQSSECFQQADSATAAYWYETILGVDPQHVEAQARYEELKP